jgi:DNA-binding NarL/FixJ family response regulator
VVVVFEARARSTTHLMRVVGAFVDMRVAGLAIESMSDLPGVELFDCCSTAEAVVELCSQEPTDVILVSGDFFPHVETVRNQLAERGLASPLWIAFIGPPTVYSREKAHALDIYIGVHSDDFTPDRWQNAVEKAASCTRCDRVPLRAMTAATVEMPRNALAALLGPCGFRFGPNLKSRDDLLAGIFLEQPHMVFFCPRMIEEVGEVRLALRNSNVTEPRWVLILTHIDPLTLLRAANIGVEHMFTFDQMEPVDEFAALLRSFVDWDTKVDTPLSRVSTTLAIAKDDNDRAILQLLATGATNDSIAAQIFASEQTVKNRLSRMMKLVGVSNRTELALLLTGTKMPPPRHFSLTDDIPAPRLLPSPSDTASPSGTVLPSPSR